MNSMKTKNLIIICITIILCGIIFWPTLYKYDKTTINGNSIPLKINRLTGNTEYYILGRWNKQENEKKRGNIISLPKDELSKLNASASFSFGSFKGNIYNGSNWRIKEIIVQIITQEQDGSIIWNRSFKTNVDILPLSAEEFYIKVGDDKNFASFVWAIVEAKGYKPES